MIKLATETELSIGNLAYKLINQINPETKIETDLQRLRPDKCEVQQLLGSNAKLKSLTGWRPEFSFDEGLQETIAWFSDPENLQKYKPYAYNLYDLINNKIKMDSIYIIGSGGFAKEVYFLLDEINKSKKIFDFKGFIDYEPQDKVVKVRNQNLPLFKENEFLQKYKNVNIAIGIGDPVKVKKILLRYNDYKFPNLIHPSFIGDYDSIELGAGNIITAGCIFTVDISIGSFNIFNLNTTIGHDAKIGDMNILNPGCNVSGGVLIGNCNLIGTNATILQYISIGSFSKIGAGAVINKNVASNTVVVGVPGRVIKEI